jgi:hypothetical protein
MPGVGGAGNPVLALDSKAVDAGLDFLLTEFQLAGSVEGDLLSRFPGDRKLADDLTLRQKRRKNDSCSLPG